MKGEKTFGVRVEGIHPYRVEKYGPVINIASYGKSKGKKEGTLKMKYAKDMIEREYSNGRIPPLVEDLINIALATFCGDKIISRDIAIGSKRVEDRYFTRKIKFVVPVSNKEIWQEVQHKLEKTISFMTYDLFQYRFIKREAEKIDVSTKESGHDSVALFSGGLDSLAGSYFLSKKGYKPIFVSINHTKIGSILSNLYEVLPKESAREIRVEPENIGTKESTQFSRSFVYLTFATAIAMAHKNINRTFIPENGIIARQIGLKEGRHGTRTAHPQFLVYFKDLVNSIFPEHKISVENPFSYKTKKEIIGEIGDKTKIKNAISCAHTRFLKKKSKEPEHCGMGIPCLIRTIALVASNIPWVEETLNIRFNPFLIDFSNPEIRFNVTNPDIPIKMWYRDGLVNVLDTIKMAREIKNQPYKEIVSTYPEFLDNRVYDLYKRFSQEVLKAVEYYEMKNSSLKMVYSG